MPFTNKTNPVTEKTNNTHPTDFHAELKSLSQSKLWKGYLIVKNNTLTQTNFALFLLEKFKKLFGITITPEENSIKETVYHYLELHKDEIKNDDDIKMAISLAKKVGLTPSIQQLINEIQLKRFEDITQAMQHPKGILQPLLEEELEKITDIFANIYEGMNEKFLHFYYDHNFKGLENNLTTTDEWNKFASWLLTQFLITNAETNDYRWHSDVIGLLCRKASKFPENPKINQKQDLLLAALISKAAPLSTEGNRKVLDFWKIFMNIVDVNLPTTCAIILKRLVKIYTYQSIINWAVYNNNSALLKIIIKEKPEEIKSATLQKRESGMMLLHWTKTYEIAKLLADVAPEEFKASIKVVRESDGFTALHEAINKERTEIVKLMAEVAPEEFKDLMTVKAKGSTPLQLAIYRANKEIIQIIAETAPEEFPTSLSLPYNDKASTLFRMKAFNLKIPKKFKQIYQSIKALNRINKEMVNRKLLAHAFHIKGNSSLIEAKTKNILHTFSIEGHFSHQWFHLISKNLEKFNNNYSNILTNNEFHFLKETLDSAANDYSTSYEDRIQRIKKGLPTILSLGFSGHAVSVLIWGDLFIVCNRGDATRRPIEVYHFDPELLNENILKEIYEVILKDEQAYRKYFFETLPPQLKFSQTTLDEKLEKVVYLPSQVVGNCSFISPITAIYAMMLLMKVRGMNERGLLNIEKEMDIYPFSKEAVSLYQTWLAHEQICILERNLLPPKEPSLTFEKDHRLIHQALAKSYLLPLDKYCKKRLKKLTQLYIQSESDPVFRSQIKSHIAYWKTKKRVSLLEMGTTILKHDYKFNYFIKTPPS